MNMTTTDDQWRKLLGLCGLLDTEADTRLRLAKVIKRVEIMRREVDEYHSLKRTGKVRVVRTTVIEAVEGE